MRTINMANADFKSATLKAVIEIGTFDVRIRPVAKTMSEIWHFKFTEIGEDSKFVGEKWIKMEYWDDTVSHNCTKIHSSHLKTGDDILYYVLYHLFEKIEYCTLSNLRRHYDKYIYLTHMLVKYFGLDFVFRKVSDNHICITDEAVRFMQSTLLIAFRNGPNPYYKRIDFDFRFFTDVWYDFDELHSSSLKCRVNALEYLLGKITYHHLMYSKDYNQLISSDLFAKISNQMSHLYNPIKVKNKYYN